MIPHVAAGGSAPHGDLFGEDSTLSDAGMSQFSHGARARINGRGLAISFMYFLNIFLPDYCVIRKSVMIKRT
ncbi:MAG: hypothetical protein ABN478_07800, partial [Mixta sp.]